MKHILSLLLTTLLAITLSAQTKPVYTITADSTKLTGCDSNELIIENHTRTVPGFLYNTGNGRTIFKRPLTKISDTFFLVGADTLKLRNPNAWIQGGNSFGTTGILGTWDNNNLDFYTNHTRRARLDSLGNLLIGYTSNSGYNLDVNGSFRARYFVASVGDAYDIRFNPAYTYGFSVDGSMIMFGNIVGSLGTNKQALGLIPANSLILGGTNQVVTMTDAAYNPIFMINGYGKATINGGYNGVVAGGNTGNTANMSAFDFAINGGRGTGSGTAGDIILSTGNSQASGTTIHTMTNRWWLKGGTGYFSNTSTPTSSVDVTGANGYSQFRMRTTYTPASSSDTNGNTGDFSWDGNYFYIKTASGWKRAALTTF